MVKPTSMFKLGILAEDDVKRVMAAQAGSPEDIHWSAQALSSEAVSLDDLLNFTVLKTMGLSAYLHPSHEV